VHQLVNEKTLIVSRCTVCGKRERSIWTKDWLKCRRVFGHGNLIKELDLSSPLDYKNYLQICPLTFGELLELITPHVQRDDTNMRSNTTVAETVCHFAISCVWAHLWEFKIWNCDWTGDVVQQLPNLSIHASHCCTPWLFRKQNSSLFENRPTVAQTVKPPPHTISLRNSLCWANWPCVGALKKT
jgi:hypothetical protein